MSDRISLPGTGAGRRGLHSLMWQKRRAQRAWTMVVTAVLEPITRICPDSGSGLGGVGMEAGEVSFESGRESLNIWFTCIKMHCLLTYCQRL